MVCDILIKIFYLHILSEMFGVLQLGAAKTCTLTVNLRAARMTTSQGGKELAVLEVMELSISWLFVPLF